MSPPGYLRPTAASDQHIPRDAKTPEVIAMEIGARKAHLRAAKMIATTASARNKRDGRTSILHCGTARVSGDYFSDSRSAHDFGIVPCALPLQKRGFGRDPVERAKAALQRKPDGWLEYSYYTPKRVLEFYAERRRKFEEAEAAEEAALQAEVNEAAALAQYHQELEELELKTRMEALDAHNASLRGEIEAGAATMGSF